MTTLMKFAFTPALLLIVFGLCLAISPTKPKPLSHIADRFQGVDWSALPELQTAQARDGAALAYRLYGAPVRAGGAVTLALHGSGGSGTALHRLALSLAEAEAGRTVIVPDIRGHGTTGVRGDVAYIGQPMDDLDDLLSAVAPGHKVDMLGFSMGGGLALKYAAARPGKTGDVTLLSPYLAYDAPPMQNDNPYATETVWAAPSVPRLATLGLLNGVGVTALNHLPVVALATRDEDADRVVKFYTYRALTSVNPTDWRADIAALAPRLTVLVGERDELHAAPGYADALADAPAARLITVPETDHMGLTLDDAAIQTVTALLGEAS